MRPPDQAGGEGAAQPAKIEDFWGYEVWIDPDGRPMVTLYRAGHMTDLRPDDEAAHQVVGFFTLDHRPTLKPI